MMDFVLGLDPGNEKFGWAYVNADGSLVASGIIPSMLAEGLMDFLLAGNLQELRPYTLENPGTTPGLEPPSSILVGNGTARQALYRLLDSKGKAFRVVDEAYTTIEARSLYWELHPPHGWRRLLPKGLRIPPRIVDDLAAWALVRRFLSSAAEYRRDAD